LSAGDLHSKVRRDARTASSVSAKSRAVDALDDYTKTELKDAAKKLLILCTPWPLWTVSGCWITGPSHSPTAGVITATDTAGKEILSYIPRSVLQVFFSKAGQSLVSFTDSITSTLTNYRATQTTQVSFTMGTTRSTHTNRLRVHANLIFGEGVEHAWFATSYDRGSVEQLQVLAGAHITAQGKKYRILPPVLFPAGTEKKKDVFLNPAIARVSVLLYQVSTTWYTNRM
jgi:hypothetical protein